MHTFHNPISSRWIWDKMEVMEDMFISSLDILFKGKISSSLSSVSISVLCVLYVKIPWLGNLGITTQNFPGHQISPPCECHTDVMLRFCLCVTFYLLASGLFCFFVSSGPYSPIVFLLTLLK